MGLNKKEKLNQLNFLKNEFSNVNPLQETSKNKYEETLDSNSPLEDHDKGKIIESILILDTETTGLDSDKDEVIEIGCILFHVTSRSVLSQVSFLIPVESNEAQHVNGISAEISNFKQPWNEGLNFFLKLVDCCDLIVAHNAAFDKKWFGKGKLPKLHKKWICSLEDVNWGFNKLIKNRPSVTNLALGFGVPVWSLHRALSDCFYLSEVFKKCDDLELILLKALEPRLLYKAIVSYEDRYLAKNAGFRWNDPIQGAWTRRLTENEALEIGFKVQMIPE